MYCAVVHIVLIISLASRKHIESDNIDGTGDPPPMWPLLLIGSVLLRQCFKSISCFCWAQVLNPNVIFLDCKYICVSSHQLCYVIQKRFWLASPSQMVQEITEIEVFTLIWQLLSWPQVRIVMVALIVVFLLSNYAQYV